MLYSGNDEVIRRMPCTVVGFQELLFDSLHCIFPRVQWKQGVRQGRGGERGRWRMVRKEWVAQTKPLPKSRR